MSTGRVKLAAERLPMIAGGVSLLLGLVVFLGWHSRQAFLIQVLPQFVPMQYNTALGFMLSGLAMILVSRRMAWPAALLSILTIIVGSLTGLQYLVGADFGIDQLFMTHYITTETSNPGRMAPNTAISFVMAGTGLLAALTTLSEKRRWVVGVIGSIILGLGLVAVAGYAVGLSPAYGWGVLTRMAMHTAAGFSVLGIGLISMAWRGALIDESLEDKPSAWWPVSAGIFVISFSVFITDALVTQERLLSDQVAGPSQAFAPSLTLAFGIIMGILLGTTLWFNRRSRLRAAVAERLAKRLVREKGATRASEGRYRHLIDSAEISIWDEDFTAVFDALERLRVKGVEDLEQHLADNPDFALEMAALVVINRVNSATLRLFGCASEDQFISSIDGVFNTESYRVFADELCAIWRGDTHFRAESSHLTFAGRKLDVVISLPVPKTRAEAGSVPVSIFDITDLRKAEVALRDSEQRFRKMFETIGTGTLVVGPDGIIQVFNPAAESIFGYKSDEVVGKNISKLMPEPDRSAHDRYIQNYITTGEAKIVGIGRQVMGLRKNKEKIPLQIEIREMKVGDDVSFVGSIADLTEIKSLEKQLLRSQRMEAVGQLTGGVAHDFNNLMAVMIGYAEMLGDTIRGNAEAEHQVTELIRAVERGANLTQRLLAFSRQLALSPKAADINHLVLGLEDMLRRTLGESIDLTFAPAEDLWPVMIDTIQLEHALVNLCLNARDAMPTGGSLVIDTANTELDEAYAEQYEELAPGDYLLVSVSDTGTGMTAQVLDRAFEPFFTTKGVGEGSGLGLSMVFGFVKQSGGHATIYSETGKGTTVNIYLPRWEGAEEQVSGEIKTAAELPRGVERILVVEDEEAVLEISRSVLREYGYEVVTALDAKAALEHLRDGPPFDLLFTDLVLPGGMNGAELAVEAGRLQSGIRVLYSTGYSENVVVHHGDLGEGVTLLKKPYVRKQLLETIREVLDGG